MSNYLAVDLGASSYRMMLSDGINLEEILRFDDHLVEIDGKKYWDITVIYNHIIDCLELLTKRNIKITSMSINSWGCDYAPILNLYDFSDDARLKSQVYGSSYLNKLTTIEKERIDKIFTNDQLFELTAVNKQLFNTIYRLPFVDTRITFIASYIEMLLTGEVYIDKSIASTTQLVDRISDEYSPIIIRALDIDINLLPNISLERYRDVNIIHKKYKDIKVISGTGHDTSYAFYRYSPDTIIINIGSWVICGQNIDLPRCFIDTFNYERGLKSKYKVVTNTLGMNGFNHLLKEHSVNLSYDEISSALFAINVEDIVNLDELDINMEIRKQLPFGEMWDKQIAVYLNSVAESIDKKISMFKCINSTEIKKIAIVGGGSNNNYLMHQIQTRISDRYQVNIGDSESTVLGNIQFQMEVENGVINK